MSSTTPTAPPDPPHQRLAGKEIEAHIESVP